MSEITRDQASPRIIENTNLSDMTTLGIGGSARFFTEVTDTNELGLAIQWSRARNLPLFILGGGSNILVADVGFNGLVIKMALRGIDTDVQDNVATITAGAGEPWDGLVAYAVASGFAGIECLSGIPGLVGATPIQNVGAYGQEVSDTITEVEAFDTTTNQSAHIVASDCLFGYRSSRFKTHEPGRFIITRVRYRLAPGPPAAIKHAELAKSIRSSPPSLPDVRAAVLAIRRSKGMVLDSGDPDTRSVGSFFVNPVVTDAELKKIQSRAQAAGVDLSGMPVFSQGGGLFKLSAAWFIERAGFNRGHARGKAAISSKHSLAITNRGGAAARDIVGLAEEIKSNVFDRFGIELIPEPVLVGF
ncbi:MAG TPA: UDP-N-acetylmuramate dehydrogenase [Blastocatellia bacterium]|nr:UDP-N-acetylmuramate dehydrogenase [Blastocatellia bacterium]